MTDDKTQYAIPPLDEATMKHVEADHQQVLEWAAEFDVRFKEALDPHLPVKTRWLSPFTPIVELMNGSKIDYAINDLEAAFGIVFPTTERGDVLGWNLLQLRSAVMRKVCNKSEVEKKKENGNG